MSRFRKRGGRRPDDALSSQEESQQSDDVSDEGYDETESRFIPMGQLWEVKVPLEVVHRTRGHPMALAAWVTLFTRMREKGMEGSYLNWPDKASSSVIDFLCADLGIDVDTASMLITTMVHLGLAERRERGLDLLSSPLEDRSLRAASERFQARLAAYRQRADRNDQLGLDL